MNLMIVLVPILLMNMVIAHTSVLELNFPAQDQISSEEEQALQLQVIILDDQIVVSDNKGGIIKLIANKQAAKLGESKISEQYDFEMLGQVMQDLKQRIPEKKDITVMAKKKTSYQTLVSVMDKVRSFKAVVAGSVVHAELFPEISIADAPEIMNSQEELVRSERDYQSGKVRS
jgi:biopolymer transport protein ExbD